MSTSLLVGSTPDALAAELIKRIVSIAEQAVLARGVCNVAVSGGSMPKVSRLLLAVFSCFSSMQTAAAVAAAAAAVAVPIAFFSSLELNPNSF